MCSVNMLIKKCLHLQRSVDKDKVPLLGGEHVLGYFSTNMNSIVGLSENFQVRWTT